MTNGSSTRGHELTKGSSTRGHEDTKGTRGHEVTRNTGGHEATKNNCTQGQKVIKGCRTRGNFSYVLSDLVVVEDMR